MTIQYMNTCFSYSIHFADKILMEMGIYSFQKYKFVCISTAKTSFLNVVVSRQI